MMAIDGMRYEIEFVKVQHANKKEEENQVIALVTFERGGKVQARYTFELASNQEQYDYTDEVSNFTYGIYQIISIPHSIVIILYYIYNFHQRSSLSCVMVAAG